MFCSKCGFNLPDGCSFCPECGTKIIKVSTETQTQTVNNSADNGFSAQNNTEGVYSQQNNANNFTQPNNVNAYSQQSNVNNFTQPNNVNAYSQQSNVNNFTQPNNVGNYAQPNVNSANAYIGQNVQKPVKKKRVLPKIIAVVVALAVVASAVFVVPNFIGNVSGDSDNVFEEAAGDVDKDSEAKPLLKVFSAFYDTVFKAESLEINVPAYGGSVSFSGVWGDDLNSSSFYLNIQDDMYAAFKNGTFVVTDGFDARKVDIKALLDNPNGLINELPSVLNELFSVDYAINSVQETIDDANDRLYDEDGNLDTEMSDRIDYYEKQLAYYQGLKNCFDTFYNDDPNFVVDMLLGLAKSNHLSFDNLNALYSYIVQKMPSSEDMTYTILRGTGSLKNVLEAFSDFLANGLTEDQYSVTLNEMDEKVNYTLRFNLLEVYVSLFKYLVTNEKSASWFGSNEVSEAIDDMESSFNSMSQSEKDEYNIVAQVDVVNGFVNTVNVLIEDEDIFDLYIYSINSADPEININKIFEICDDIPAISTPDRLVNLFDSNWY